MPTAGWSVTDSGGRLQRAVSDGTRVFLAFARGQIAARDRRGRPRVWRIDQRAEGALAVGGDLLFVSGRGMRSRRCTPRTARRPGSLPRVQGGGTAGGRRHGCSSPSPTPKSSRSAPRTGDRLAPRRRRRAAGSRRSTSDLLFSAPRTAGCSLPTADGAVAWEKYFSTAGVTALAASAALLYVGARRQEPLCFEGQERRPGVASRGASARVVIGPHRRGRRSRLFRRARQRRLGAGPIERQPALAASAARARASTAFSRRAALSSCRSPAPRW